MNTWTGEFNEHGVHILLLCYVLCYKARTVNGTLILLLL
jgi:hypothetical protein